MQIHLDAVGGVAGDMFIAAVTDAFPHLRDGLLTAVRDAGLPDTVLCRFEAGQDHALTGSRFIVELPFRPLAHDVDHDHSHDHAHGHSHPHGHEAHDHSTAAGAYADFAELRTHLLETTLSPEVKHHAIGIFTILAAAEAKIHGVTLDEVSFHELGEWDSIADIVGAAYLIAALDAQHWTIGTLPLGSGFIRTAHGKLPVPVPATAAILEGYAFVDDGLKGERITPTGAAIVRHLNCHQGHESKMPRVLKRSGYGFGTKRFPGISNVLRVLAFEASPQLVPHEASEASVIGFEVDDQTPEDLAIGLDRIRAQPGVLDVMQSPVFGKKGRIAAHVQVLTEPDARDRIIEACFLETTTIGLRFHNVHRQRLPRDLKVVQVGNHAIRVKVAHRPAAVTAKAESDDTAQLPGSDTRMRVRHAAESAGLDTNQDKETPA
ncbi:MAG: LarC family nickel insertion protein [Burkholderiales bacterium]